MIIIIHSFYDKHSGKYLFILNIYFYKRSTICNTISEK